MIHGYPGTFRRARPAPSPKPPPDVAILDGIRIVTLAPNVPGPVAAARLRALGASVVKLEAPGGDLLEEAAPAWFARLHEGIETVTCDLKTAAGREQLDAHLAHADVFLTSMRISALERLGYGWQRLRVQAPALIHVAIVGREPASEERPGHDLTYLAEAGLLDPQSMPRSLFVDLAGAERAVSAVLAALFTRARTGDATQTFVPLASVAHDLAAPYEAGLTNPGGILGGGFAAYRVYRAADGYVALAALEPRFFETLCDRLLESGAFASLEEAFASQSCADWERFSIECDLPIETVKTARKMPT
jgi:crotonobetainyl-CoA:carnitine CoA-transferase CaiB-like acyl-CoA transferase